MKSAETVGTHKPGSKFWSFSTNNTYTGLYSPLFVCLSHIIKLLCQYQLVEGGGNILKLGIGCFTQLLPHPS